MVFFHDWIQIKNPRSFWIFIESSELWWKVPGPDSDNETIIIQNQSCKRCNNKINCKYLPNECYPYLNNPVGYYFQNNIYCYYCINIVKNKNVFDLIKKREICLNNI